MKRHFRRWLVARTLVLTAGLAMAAIGATPEGVAQEKAAALVAHVVWPVHPILIRNEQGPLLRVVVVLPKGSAVRATSLGKITPRDDVANARQRIGVALRKHNDDGVHTDRIPALTTSVRGTLLAVYDMRRRMGRDLQEDIDIGLSRSKDGG